MIPCPSALVIYPDEDQPALVQTLVDGITAAIPDLAVQVGGPAPSGPYAVCEFIPDDITAYRDALWVHISGAGANGMLAALKRDGVRPKLITRTVGEMGHQIGEYVLSYCLADAQKHTVRARLQDARVWNSRAARPARLSGQTALIFGTGGIGAGVASVLGSIGMNCTGVSRSGRARSPFDRVMTLDQLPDDLGHFDICVAVFPATAATHHLIGRDIFSRLDGVLFVNAGRGPTVDMAALTTAIDAGHVRTAVLDVFETEPLPAESDLWTHERVVITPHVSGLTQPEDTVRAFVAAYRALERGEMPDLIVDPDAGY